MARRRGSRSDAGQAGAAAVAASYEGPEVLTALLGRAGSPHTAEEVADRFARASQAGEERAEVIPTLFPEEPRFATPDDARRLYGNLFGLWARVAAGQGAQDDAPAPVPEAAAAPPEPPPLPERGTCPGDVLPTDLVEAVWKTLAALPSREVQRQRDRFMNAQPDLLAWLDVVQLPASGALAAQDLVFEAWAMFDQAFGDRLGVVDYRTLEEVQREPPPLEAVQPALGAYAAEQLDVLEGEDPDFRDAERAQVERAISAVAAALTGALREATGPAADA
jgi:hypothetical protein